MGVDDTAKSWFMVALANGRKPSTILGGPLDGVRYFFQTFDGNDYLISEIGLVTPAEVAEHGGRLGEEPHRGDQ